MDHKHFILVFLLEEVPCTNLIETDHIDNNTIDVLDRSTSSNRIYNRTLMFETIQPENTPHSQHREDGFPYPGGDRIHFGSNRLSRVCYSMSRTSSIFCPNHSSASKLSACVLSSVLLGGAVLQGCPGFCLDIRFLHDMIIRHGGLLVSTLVEGAE